MYCLYSCGQAFFFIKRKTLRPGGKRARALALGTPPAGTRTHTQDALQFALCTHTVVGSVRDSLYTLRAHTEPPTRFTSLRSLSTLSSHTRTRRKNCPSQARLANTRSTHSTLFTQTQRRSLPPRPPLLTPKASLYPHAWLSRPCLSAAPEAAHLTSPPPGYPHSRTPQSVPSQPRGDRPQREAHHTKHTHTVEPTFFAFLSSTRGDPLVVVNRIICIFGSRSRDRKNAVGLFGLVCK